MSDRDGNWEVYVMDPDGANLIRLTQNAVRGSNPSWAPDGPHLFFYSDRDDNREVYVMDADGAAHGLALLRRRVYIA